MQTILRSVLSLGAILVLAACAGRGSSPGACPRAGLTADTERIRLTTSQGLAVDAVLEDLTLVCRRNKTTGEITLRYSLTGRIYPTEDKSQLLLGRARLPLYAAVLDDKQELLVRTTHTRSLRLARGRVRRFMIDMPKQQYTPPEDTPDFSYSLLVGFVMSAEDIELNRRINEQNIIPPREQTQP